MDYANGYWDQTHMLGATGNGKAGADGGAPVVTNAWLLDDDTAWLLDDDTEWLIS